MKKRFSKPLRRRKLPPSMAPRKAEEEREAEEASDPVEPGCEVCGGELAPGQNSVCSGHIRRN